MSAISISADLLVNNPAIEAAVVFKNTVDAIIIVIIITTLMFTISFNIIQSVTVIQV